MLFRLLRQFGPALAAAVLLVACAGADPGPAPDVPRVASLADSDVGYRLKPGDSLKIVVFAQDRFSGDYKINNRGEIILPSVGAINTAGLTLNGLQAVLKDRLRQSAGVLNPQVSVLLDVTRNIQIVGAVRNPGEYPFSSGLTIASAVALAGGYAPRANTSYVVLKRAASDRPEARLVSEVPFLNPGDALRIPER